MQNLKRNGKKRNLKSFTNRKDSAKKEAKATDTKKSVLLLRRCIIIHTPHAHLLFTCMEKKKSLKTEYEWMVAKQQDEEKRNSNKKKKVVEEEVSTIKLRSAPFVSSLSPSL